MQNMQFFQIVVMYRPEKSMSHFKKHLYNSVAEHLPCMIKVLGLIPKPQKEIKEAHISRTL